MKQILAFPCIFFFGMIAPMYLEELDHLAPHDTIFFIQDLDWVLGVCQIFLERCHFWQYHIHRYLQALLQLQHVEDVMNSSQ
jgi:hypothetical protein